MPELLLLVAASAVIGELWLARHLHGLARPRAAAVFAAHSALTTLLVALGSLALYRAVLAPLALTALHLPALLALGASTAALLACIAARLSPGDALLVAMLRPLAVTQPLGLALALAFERDARGSGEAAGLAVGVSLGSAILFVVFDALLARIDTADVPRRFRGAPIVMITAGLVCLGALGLAGLLPD